LHSIHPLKNVFISLRLANFPIAGNWLIDRFRGVCSIAVYQGQVAGATTDDNAAAEVYEIGKLWSRDSWKKGVSV